MAKAAPACLYQETRLNLDPAFPGSSVDVDLSPNSSRTSFSSRLSPKRRRIDKQSQYTEESFSRKHLASESSIHFRARGEDNTAKSPFPRCILWRVLEDRKVLELSAVDIIQDQSEKHDPLLVLRLDFDAAIRRDCVVFPEHDVRTQAMTLFVVTVSGELYTITIPREAFVRADSPETDAEAQKKWYSTYKPNAFSYRSPYRIFAKTPEELWAGLADGSLVRLESRHGKGGKYYKESYYTSGGWRSSMRELISWKNHVSIRYGDEDLSPQSPASMRVSPDGRHIWTVCLDHTIRAWSIETGKLTYNVDMVQNEARDLSQPPQYTLDPGNSSLLQILPAERQDEYILATFSPHFNQFTLRIVRDADSPEHGIGTLAEDFAFTPPMEDLVDVNLWTLESFFIEHAKGPDQKHWSIWMLVRYGPRCKVFSILFNLNDRPNDLERAWKLNWATVDPGLSVVEHLNRHQYRPVNADTWSEIVDPTGLVEKWTDFLFYPGRFTHATLETALSIYMKGFGKNDVLLDFGDRTTLKERVCQAVGQSVVLDQNANMPAAYGRFKHDTATQWNTFYGVVKDLHQRRVEPLVLAFDSEEELPWLVHADCISTIRTLNQVELLWHNRETFLQASTFNVDNLLLQSIEDTINTHIGILFHAVDILRQCVSQAFLASFESSLKAVMFQDSAAEDDVSRQMQDLFDQTGFSNEVSEDDYNMITQALEGIGGFSELSDDLIVGALELLGEDQQGKQQGRKLSRHGTHTLVRGVQDSSALVKRIALDILMLVVFTSQELEPSDLPDKFTPDSMFLASIEKLKQNELLSWCAGSQRSESLALVHAHNINKASESYSAPFDTCATVLETIFLGDWTEMHFPSGPLSSQITSWCWIWPFALSGAQPSTNQNRIKQYSNRTLFIMCNLLSKSDLDLATQFLKFLPDTPWAKYLTARLLLARSDFDAAFLYFEASAPGLCNHFNVEAFDSDPPLLRPHERVYFDSGLAQFFVHVLNLFESAKAPSYGADIAKLAMTALEKERKPDDNLRSEVLSRHFTMLLEICRFEEAFDTLSQYTNKALRKPSLHSLVQKMLNQSQVQLLLSLPYPDDMGIEVDSFLSTLAGNLSLQFTPTNSLSGADPPSYHRILYAFRLQRHDFRGAAIALWDRLQALKVSQRAGLRGSDIDEEIAQTYLALINMLALVDPEEAWILIRPLPDKTTKKGRGLPGLAEEDEDEKPKRQIVTLSDVRRMWSDELDRVADLEAGRYPLSFGAGEEDSFAESVMDTMPGGMEVSVS